MNIELEFNLHPSQAEVFHCPARFIVCVAGRRFGKSWLACVRAITSALDVRNEQRMPVFLIAPTYPSARTIYWRRLHDLAGDLIVNSNVNLGIVELINGVEIHIKGADRPDSLRGVGLWDAVIDEFADQKVEVWELIIQPALSDAVRFGGGRALFIGTPKGRNHFYSLAEQAAKNEGGEWALFTFTSADNPFIPKTEIESAARRMSSSAFRQEYGASFESSGGLIFQRPWIKYAKGPDERLEAWRNFVTVDLAGFVDSEKDAKIKVNRRDTHVVACVAVNGVKWHVREVVYGRWGVQRTADNIVQMLKRHRPAGFGIEKGALKKAVEPYLLETMQRNNCMMTIHELSHGNQLKTDRVVWALQGRFEHGHVTLEEGAPWIPEFEDQLLNFPSTTVHDDIPDAVSYVDQLSNGCVWSGFETTEGTGWEPVDVEAGY